MTTATQPVIFSLTKLSSKHDPLWKVQAWCRRNAGTWYLYQATDGHVTALCFEKHATDLVDECIEKWVDGVRVYRDQRRPEQNAN